MRDERQRDGRMEDRQMKGWRDGSIKVIDRWGRDER